MPQLSYSINHEVARAGQIYALHPRTISTMAIETPAGADFGIVVSRGTDEVNEAVIGGDAAFLGVTVQSMDREGTYLTGEVRYSEKDAAAIMRAGWIWVACPSGCTTSSAVKYDDVTGVIDSGAAGAGETQLDGCSWESVTTAGDIGLLWIENSSNT